MASENKIRLSPQEMSILVLSNLHKIKNNDYVSNILIHLDNSSVRHHKSLYEEANKFLKVHGKYPDASFLKTKFPSFIEDSTTEFSEDISL